MLITGPEGFSPIQKKSARPVTYAGQSRRQVQDGYYDQYTASPAAGQTGVSFRDAVASLSYQVRTHNTTGKIQELRQEVSSGQYQIDPRETAARMLLLETEE